MLTPATIAAIDGYWAEGLGVPAGLLRRPGVRVAALAGDMAEYRGAYLLRRGSSMLFAVPAQHVERVRQAVRACMPDAVFDPEFLAELFGPAVERIIGPAYQGFADAAAVRPVDGRGTRPLTGGDVPALKRLRAACDATEWDHSAIEVERPVSVFACFVGGDIAAAGALKRGREPVAAVGIITHPAYRARGYGRAVVSAMTAHAFDSGLSPRFQTLVANEPSVAIARSLGYVEYGHTLAVRLREVGLPA